MGATAVSSLSEEVRGFLWVDIVGMLGIPMRRWGKREGEVNA